MTTATTTDKIAVTLPRGVVLDVLDAWDIYRFVVDDGEARFTVMQTAAKRFEGLLRENHDAQEIAFEATRDGLIGLLVFGAAASVQGLSVPIWSAVRACDLEAAARERQRVG